MDTFDDIYHALDKYKIGDKVSVEFLRDDEIKKINLKLNEL